MIPSASASAPFAASRSAARRQLTWFVLTALIACAAFGPSAARAAATAASVCGQPQAGYVACDSELLVNSLTRQPIHPVVHPIIKARRTNTAGIDGVQPAGEPAAAVPPAVATAPYLQQAYDLTYLSRTQGWHDTVAIIDAYDDPNAATDLGVFRSQMGMAACTSANGCFRQVNENGATSPLPTQDSGWNIETSLDLDAVSSLCPNCDILLVEASSASFSDMDQAVMTAAAMGATEISASWSGSSSTAISGTYTFPGIATVAAAGDTGYLGAGMYAWPAALPGVTAAGGTTLNASTTSASTARGFTETAWALSNGEGSGAGCALVEPKPSYQTDTACTGRSYADVSADANPNTALNVYDSNDGGWLRVGGTSLSAPLIAAFDAVTGVNGATPQWAYTDRSLLNDPSTGSIGTCATSISFICTAGLGFDGPTGNGSISGGVTTGAPGIGGPSIGTGSGNSYASSVSSTGATLSGGVYPNGLSTTYYWEYGTTAGYGSQTTSGSVGSGANASAATSTLSGLTPGTTYHYRLVAQNRAGTTYGYDYTFTTPSVPVPLNTVAPTLAGSAALGQKLTVGTGTWNPAASKYAYQWQRSSDGGSSWTNISSATFNTYTLTAADRGGVVRGQIVATNTYGSANVYSAQTGTVASGAPVSSGAPAVSGLAAEGQKLTATTGTWSPAGTSYAYQWQRSSDGGNTWTSIPSAVYSYYTPGAADLGDTVQVRVTATNTYGTTVAYSASTATVASGAPARSASPAVSGLAAEGQKLTATAGTWAPAGTSYAYQWQRSSDGGNTWTNIPSATLSYYTLGAADLGDTVQVQVTATNTWGTATASSASTATVASGAPVSTVKPAITGSAGAGQKLTATAGTWNPAGTSYAYQWQYSSDGGNTWTNIAAATSYSYTLTTTYVGDTLQVRVTATNTWGTTTASSPSTATVASGAPVSTVAPKISGTMVVGQRLSAGSGTWAPAASTYTYQWQRSATSDPSGTWTNITGATSSAYALTAADNGNYVRVTVTAKNTYGSATAESAVSNQVT